MAQLAGIVATAILCLIKSPWTHVISPCIQAFLLIIKHSFVFPALLIIRTLLFGFVYLPLRPVLYLLDVRLETTVPVELALWRLVKSAWPHLQLLVGHLYQYLMVSVFLGTAVGIVAGVNISIASNILRLSKRDDKKDVRSSQSTHYTPKDSHNAINFGHHRLLGNAPRVLSNSPPKPAVKPELSVADTMVYEDDDGYNFMALGPVSRATSVQCRSNSSLLSATIIEESESELGQFPDSAKSPSLEELVHDTSTYSTGFDSVSIFSPRADQASTGDSDRENSKPVSAVKLEPAD